MTAWHLAWQRAVPPERREVVIGPHRADVVTASGGVVELQHSAISPEVITEREEFYGERMAWIFDVSAAFTAGRLTVHGPPYKSHAEDLGADLFQWRRPCRSLGACKRTLLLDLGNGLVLHVVTPRDPRWDSCLDSGWCRAITRESAEGWLRVGGRWQVRRFPPEPPPEPRRCGCGEVH